MDWSFSGDQVLRMFESMRSDVDAEASGGGGATASDMPLTNCRLIVSNLEFAKLGWDSEIMDLASTRSYFPKPPFLFPSLCYVSSYLLSKYIETWNADQSEVCVA